MALSFVSMLLFFSTSLLSGLSVVRFFGLYCKYQQLANPSISSANAGTASVIYIVKFTLGFIYSLDTKYKCIKY